MREEAGQRVLAVFGAVHARDLGEASDEAFDGARDAAERVGDERDDGVALDVDGVVVVAVARLHPSGACGVVERAVSSAAARLAAVDLDQERLFAAAERDAVPR